MKDKPVEKSLHHLSWQTRIYAILAISVIIAAHVFDAWNSNWVLAVLVSLAVILFFESFELHFKGNPKVWKRFRWLLIIAALAILFLTLVS